MSPSASIKLFVTDIDNTLFDWVHYYVTSFMAMMQDVATSIGAPLPVVLQESRDVFAVHGSIEYPFVVQELPSVARHYGDDIEKMLAGVVRSAREVFLAAAKPCLTPYPGVVPTLMAIRALTPKVPIVALTDAPRYVAAWKLNKLGLLPYFDAIYGLPDPRIPVAQSSGQVKVAPEILAKHLQHNDFGFKGRFRSLPEEYEKPGTRGLKTVLMDYELDDDTEHRRSVLWVGDNRRKDVGLGARLGVRTAWASYGIPRAEDLSRLNVFSPPQNIHKNAAVPLEGEGPMPEPDRVLKEFADIMALF